MLNAVNTQPPIGAATTEQAPPSGAATPSTSTQICAVSASAADVQAVLDSWIMENRLASRSARSVSAVMQALETAESRRAMEKGRARARKMRASAVFQGMVGIASAALSAVSGGAGAALSSASAAGTAAQAASQMRQMRILKVAADVGARVTDGAGPHVDPFTHQARRLELSMEAHRARAETQEGMAGLSAEHAQAVASAMARAVQILERCQDASLAAGRIATSRTG